MSIPGYELIDDLRRDRTDTHLGKGGGLLVYAKANVCILPCDSGCDFNQYCRFEVKTVDEKWLLTLVYRPPSSPLENCDLLLQLLDGLPPNSLLVGDFNYPYIDWETLSTSARGKKFIDKCTANLLEQMVDFPTHDKGNILDLVFTNNPEKIHTIREMGKIGKSDHTALMIEILVPKSVEPKQVNKPGWGRANWDQMKADWSSTNWYETLGSLNTEDAWQLIRNTLKTLEQKYVPVRPWRTATRPPWMSAELLRLIRSKRRLWAQHRKQNNAESLARYKEVEKIVNKKIRSAKRNLERKLAEDNSSNKSFFNYIRSNTKTRPGIGPLRVDGKTLSDSDSMAEVLNNYFSSVFQPPDTSPPPVIPPRRPGASCKVPRFRPSRIKQIIKGLKPNSEPGPDGISTRLLQGMANKLASPLSQLYEKSMKEGAVPDDWRIANVTPIFKKGSRADPGNYRPVSLTSVPGKIMEVLVKDEMVSHLDKFKLIKKTQHGFSKGRSCTTNLLEFLEKVTCVLDEGHCMDIVYLDFSKAFDMVPTARLLAKVKSHGITGPTLRWLETWLSNRTQRVVINGRCSTWHTVTSGVPQGSILGPILFAIFINDLEDNIEDMVTLVKKFADDTKLAQVINSEADQRALQSGLDQLLNWSVTWGMNFNTKKCHILHLGRQNPHYTYNLSQSPLASVTEEKDIGVLITGNLKPSRQCENAARVANGVLSQVLRTFSYRDKHVLPKIFKTYVRPHLEFAVPAWSPWQIGDIKTLEQVQFRMVKQIQGLQSSTYMERLAELGLDSLEQRRQKLDLIQTFRIIHGHDRVDHETWFSIINEERPQRTRMAQSGLCLSSTRPRTDIRANFFSQRVIRSWNSLPPDWRKYSSVAAFKSKLKKLGPTPS